MSDHSEYPLPAALLRRNPLAWLVVFGPGAIIASITLGSGELIFSTRGGALFGYHILFLFVLISVLKWGLVFAMARHMVLSGVHPYERMMDLPGPRGWFPLMLLLIATLTTPVWTSFFPAILGNFTSWVTGTQPLWNGAVDYVWGGVFLLAAFLLAITSGYTVLERVQICIVAVMMGCAIVTLVLYNPDWLDMLRGAFIPQSLHYPDWLSERYPDIAGHSVWVETTRYVGVIGGAGFDYLAYTAWLREKGWGRSSSGPTSTDELSRIAQDPHHPVRFWTRAPLVDCTCSFILVVVFSAVFVASGVVVLGPQRELPTEDNFLDLQSRFVTAIHPWLMPVYVTGAYLTIFGSLYGTLEIGVTIYQEIVRAMNPEFAARHSSGLRRATIVWLTFGAACLLVWSFVHTQTGRTLTEVRVPRMGDDDVSATLIEWSVKPGSAVSPGDVVAVVRTPGGLIDVRWDPDADGPGRVMSIRIEPGQQVRSGETLATVGRKARPRLLLAILTPANLFTGVLSVGVFCLLMPWMDWRHLPKKLWMPVWLAVLNLAAGAIFLFLGLKGYWDNHRAGGHWLQSIWFSLGGMLWVALVSVVVTKWMDREKRR
jgi:hypothetical protein